MARPSFGLSHATKSFAWRGVMEALKEDETIPAHARALIELLVEERRELVESQQRMADALERMEKKMDSITCAPASSSSNCQVMMNGSSLLDSFMSTDQNTAKKAHHEQNGGNTGETSGNTSYGNLSPILREASADIPLRGVPKMERFSPPMREQEDAEEESSEPQQIHEMILSQFAFALQPENMDSSAPKKKKRKRPSVPEVSPEAVVNNGVTMEMGHSCRFPGCNVVMEREDELIVHVATHKSVSRFHCYMCGLGIRSEARLRDHINQHTGERPYECDICRRGFSRYDARTTHMRKCAEKKRAEETEPQATVVPLYSNQEEL